MAARSGLLILLSAVLLVGLGIVMLASTSYRPAGPGGDYHNLTAQIVWAGLGALLVTLGAVTSYQRWQRVAWWALGATVLAMAACRFGPLAHEVNGAYRWLNLGFTVQPSEFAKIALILALATWFANKPHQTGAFWMGAVAPAGLIALVAGAFYVQEDLGNMMIISVLGFSLMFIVGVKIRHLLLLGLPVAAAAAFAVINNPNRMKRVADFLSKDKDWQQIHSMLAFGSGGLTGRGLGEGRMKLGYLPEAHTDFIFPMVGEEFGFAGAFGTMLLFCLLLAAGLTVAVHAPDRFGKLLGTGITTVLVMEALVNMGVCTGLLPNKGLPLPFVSYGGSSLLACSLMVGILLNIHRQGDHLARRELTVIRRKMRWTPRM
jgi:cell division protein FtsW